MSSNINLEPASQIISRLPRAFHDAVKSGQLLFFSSTVTKHVESQIEFQLRLCPALQKKPTTAKQPLDAEKRNDPFAPPYNQLYVGEIQDDEEEYVILASLNGRIFIDSLSFSYKRHDGSTFRSLVKGLLFILEENHSQNAPLSPSDLLQSYLILLAGRQAGESYMAFYNCGNSSGASQPHKHIQFLPVEHGPPLEKLANTINTDKPLEPFTIHQLPYAHGIIRLPSRLAWSPKEDVKHVLLDGFLRLLDFAVMTTRHNPDQQPGPPSYNVILTSEHLFLVPRARETHVLKTGDAISVNSLGFSGMMLVKSDEELEAVKSEGVLEILKSVGMKKSEEEGSQID